MRFIAFLVSLGATIGLVYVLNHPLGPAPALGRFFDPYSGFWQNAENTSHYHDIDMQMNGLHDKVEVYFDDRMVPHIFAQNDEDLFFMQGYITAKNRLWQMEVQTHSAAGRVSEIAGEKALAKDRLSRRIGLGYGAENSKAFIEKDAQSNDLVRAYCAGVNAYINSL
ncbi:MAG: penicillin acylase family protein, partial [Bacteroidetes bacterium]|nr:penicillin acylase family protein [Bacteroidota bacterium]